jgi:hypothetical protein
MVKVRFCTYCRALIFAGFRFCPYCGTPVSRGPSCDEALAAPFSVIEAESRTGNSRNEYLASIAERLSQLETELESIISKGGSGFSER